jgi:hypothetical protein
MGRRGRGVLVLLIAAVLTGVIGFARPAHGDQGIGRFNPLPAERLKTKNVV